ncbi:transposase family protein [Planomonospora parontospora]|nr:transposase family protein [Planomonospora parontospora]
MLSYPAAIPLSNRTLARLTELIRVRRAERRSRWRRLKPGQQALLVLAHLRNGDAYARLAAGFAIGTITAWRYVRASVDLLAALADDVQAAAVRAARPAYATLDGTLIPIDRVADQAWKLLSKLRCCPHRATPIMRAVLVLQAVEDDRYSG